MIEINYRTIEEIEESYQDRNQYGSPELICLPPQAALDLIDEMISHGYLVSGYSRFQKEGDDVDKGIYILVESEGREYGWEYINLEYKEFLWEVKSDIRNCPEHSLFEIYSCEIEELLINQSPPSSL